jgi:TetR/AcrR family acrAB operon transcriptional repressor
MARKPDIARRREIAKRAFEAIRARGVHRTSMSDIAAALDMKRPTLYWYFKDLGEIFDAVVHETDMEWRTFVAGRLAGVAHPIDFMDALIAAAADFNRGRRDQIIALFQLWAVSASQDPESLLERNREYIEPLRDGLVARLRDGMEEGVVAECDPERVVDLVLSIVDGLQVQRVTRDVDLESIVLAARDYLLEPLRTTGREE